jgi:hypothetical protein
MCECVCVVCLCFVCVVQPVSTWVGCGERSRRLIWTFWRTWYRSRALPVLFFLAFRLPVLFGYLNNEVSVFLANTLDLFSMKGKQASTKNTSKHVSCRLPASTQWHGCSCSLCRVRVPLPSSAWKLWLQHPPPAEPRLSSMAYVWLYWTGHRVNHGHGDMCIPTLEWRTAEGGDCKVGILQTLETLCSSPHVPASGASKAKDGNSEERRSGRRGKDIRGETIAGKSTLAQDMGRLCADL